MKKILPIILALAVTPIASNAVAEGETGFYAGIKTGSMDVDVSGFDSDSPLGFVFGYQQNGFGIEFEKNSTDLTLTGPFPTLLVDQSTTAIYGVYRSEGDVFFKAKLGYLNQELTSSVISASDTGTSYGFGVGAKFDTVSLEAEYTIIEADVNFLSVGLNVHF